MATDGVLPGATTQSFDGGSSQILTASLPITIQQSSDSTAAQTSFSIIATSTSQQSQQTTLPKSHTLSSGAYIGIGIGVGIGILVILILLFAFLRRKVQISWKTSKPPLYEVQPQATDRGSDEGKAELAGRNVGLARGKEELDTNANRHEASGREVGDAKLANVSETVSELPAYTPVRGKRLTKDK